MPVQIERIVLSFIMFVLLLVDVRGDFDRHSLPPRIGKKVTKEDPLVILGGSARLSAEKGGGTFSFSMQAQRAVENSFITVDEYLEGEQHTDLRREYFDGRVFAMPGATVIHDAIACNFHNHLHNHLKGSPCRAFIFNTKVHLQVLAKDLFYYPDVMVACEPLDNPRLFREKPKLIIEVLSEDENKDLVEKYFAYQRIASLEEYVVVGQNPLEPEIRIFRRAEGWEPGETHHEGEFTLRSVSLTLKVSEIYSV